MLERFRLHKLHLQTAVNDFDFLLWYDNRWDWSSKSGFADINGVVVVLLVENEDEECFAVTLLLILLFFFYDTCQRIRSTNIFDDIFLKNLLDHYQISKVFGDCLTPSSLSSYKVTYVVFLIVGFCIYLQQIYDNSCIANQTILI